MMRLETRFTSATTWCFAAVIALTATPPATSQADEPTSQFIAQWRDGTTTRATTIAGWQNLQKQFGRGEAVSLPDASIAGQRLYNPDNPVRLVRNDNLRSTLTGPYIELANGDILPGQIVAPPDDQRVSSPVFVSVAVASPLVAMPENQVIRVRTASISRVVATEQHGRPFSPGLVVSTDGREVLPKAVKWTPDGLQLLLDRSVALIAWSDLAEFHVREANRLKTILRDLQAVPSGDVNLLARMTTKSGGVLTCHCDRWAGAKVGWNYFHVLQPAWSEDGIFVPIENFVSVGYRAADEVPLSLLAAETLAERNLTGFTWRWQRNRNVQGKPLAVASRSAEFGIGTHAHSEIAFDLPAGSTSFTSWAGIDRAMGNGGCVRCKLFLNRVQGEPVWHSTIIRGGDEPLHIEIDDLKEAKRLILVTEFADSDHPPDADPLDIGDAVSWLSPYVRIDVAATHENEAELSELFPPLAGWSVVDATKQRITSRQMYISSEGRWGHAMVLNAGQSKEPVEPLVLSREVDVMLNNAWFQTAAARDRHGNVGCRITVHADGKKVPGSEGYDGGTMRDPGNLDPVCYSLGKYVGQRIKLTVTATPAEDDYENLAGIVWGELSFRPLVQGMPKNGEPIKPDVPIETVDTLEVFFKGSKTPKDATALSSKSPPLRFCPMDSGLEVPSKVKKITCRLKPEWKRFVACIGPAGLSTGTIKSFQIWMGDEMIWHSPSFTRFSPAMQIDVPIPDHKSGEQFALRVGNASNVRAVWANAGFRSDTKR